MSRSVVIIEDQRMFRDLLRSFVESVPGFEVVGLATSLAEGRMLLEEKRPSLAIVDLELPDGSGLTLAGEVEGIALLAVSSLTDPLTTNMVYDSGFHGYVEKDQPPESLTEAIETVADGGYYFTQLVRENRKRMFGDPDAINKILSPREQEIISRASQRLSNREIAELMDLSVRTVENHRYRIMKRLSLKDVSSLIAFAEETGLNRLV